MVVRERFSYKAIHDVLSGLLEHDLHAKRVNSLCDATLGVLHRGSRAVCTVRSRPRRRPQFEAQACNKAEPAPAKAEFDRLLSNSAINVDDIRAWPPAAPMQRPSN